MQQQACQVAIVGAGPAGLACAIHLRQLGVKEVLLIEREAAAGGIPRHCGHSPFGMREFNRLLSGPAYARRLVQQAIDLGVRRCSPVGVDLSCRRPPVNSAWRPKAS